MNRTIRYYDPELDRVFLSAAVTDVETMEGTVYRTSYRFHDFRTPSILPAPGTFTSLFRAWQSIEDTAEAYLAELLDADAGPAISWRESSSAAKIADTLDRMRDR